MEPADLPARPIDTRTDPTTGLPTEVVGESHYQDALAWICGGRSEAGADLDTRALLRADPENPHDENAVEVRINGELVGFLSRDLPPTFLPGCLRERLRSSGFPHMSPVAGNG